jgi:hypothetical protein
MEMGGTTTHTVHVTVKDITEEGNLVVEATIARVHGSMMQPMVGEVEFDSAKPKGRGQAMTKALTDMAGKSFIAKVDAHGKVSSLENTDALLSDKPAGPMGRVAPDEAMLKSLVEGAFGVLPSKPVAVGATWERDNTDATGRAPVKSKLMLTLAKLDDEAFEVTATGTISRADADAAAEQDEEEDSMQAEVRKSMSVSNGKITGTQLVSRKDGFIVESKSTMSMDMDMASDMGEGAA